MSDNEEGFAVEQAIQLIQYNYQPCSREWTSMAKKGYQLYKKHNPLTLLTCSARLINTSIHTEWIQSLLSISKPKNIVYSTGSRAQLNFQEQNIIFQSEFESGNLELVSRIKANQYELYMKPDSNTKCHFQWFYFKVIIKKGNKNVKFTIKNFIKSTMLYSKGLKPYCRSLKNPEYHQYRQIDSAVKFSQDLYTDCYRLQFQYNFQFDNDQIQFCSQPPYTFRQVTTLIDSLKCKKLTLTKTVMGSKIPYIIYEAKKEVKVVAVAIARQHPGQSVGSWMMQGFINALNQGKLCEHVTWVIVPMLNIDGVVIGNNRTGVLGHDFNRNWVIQESGNSRYNKLFPQIQGVISLVKSLKRKYPRKVKMFLDLHGHSSQPNVFSYGPPHQEHSQYFYQCRLFPELISKRNSNFKLSQCSYVLHPEKKNTARSIIFYNMGIPFTYTIESTFGVMNDRNVTVDDFVKIGEDIAVCAQQFLHTAVIKQNNLNFASLIEDLKIKYANAKNQGEEFDSASEASDQNPNRRKIQEMIIADQELQIKAIEDQVRSVDKPSKRYLQTKTEPSELQHKFHSLMKPIHEELSMRNHSTTKSHSKRRVNTEVELVLNKKQCIFPSISTRNSKLAFSQSSYTTNEQILQSLKINDIQKRLQKLRNSKIGKKILVINAYCS